MICCIWVALGVLIPPLYISSNIISCSGVGHHLVEPAGAILFLNIIQFHLIYIYIYLLFFSYVIASFCFVGFRGGRVYIDKKIRERDKREGERERGGKGSIYNIVQVFHL